MKLPALPQLSRPEWVLCALCVILLIIVGLELELASADHQQLAQAVETPAIELDTSPLPRPDFPALAGLRELHERPLFEEQRRPPAAPEQQTRDLAQEFRARWKLTGVILAGAARFAMLEDQLNRDGSMQLSVGAELDAWTLQELDSGRAVFSRGEEQLTLELAK